MNEIERLRDRVFELEDVLGMTGEFPDLYRQKLAVTRRPARLLGLLAARVFVSREAALVAIVGDRREGDEPQEQIISVYISRLRRALRPHGIAITTVWGRGYFMSGAEKKKLQALIDPPAESRGAA